MHVRVAPPSGGRLNSVTRPRLSRTASILLIALGAWPAYGCRRPPTRDVTFDWTLTPTPPRVGPAALELRLRDASGAPVRGAHLRIEGHMSHPGMAPALAEATESAPGVYDGTLQFAMEGDWILLVAGSLADGATVRHRIDVPHVRSR